MNNVGENFFSSPIDPFDLDKDWGRSDDDQRHRLVVTGSVNTSMDAAHTALATADARLSGEQHDAGVFGAAVQHHVRRDDRPGHRRAGRSSMARSSRGMPASASDFFSLGMRVSRSFRIGESVRAEGIARSVQPDESAQRPDADRELRRGRLSGQSVADVQSDHGGGRSTNAAVRCSGAILGRTSMTLHV